MKTITLIANAKIIVHRTNGASTVVTNEPIEIIIPAHLIDESVEVGVIELSAYAKTYKHNDLTKDCDYCEGMGTRTVSVEGDNGIGEIVHEECYKCHGSGQVPV